MGHEFFEDCLQMLLAERDQVVETFPANRTDQPFAKGIGLWGVRRRLQHPRTKATKSSVHVGSENAVAVMDHESVRMIESQEFTKLLGRPIGRRVIGHV